MKVPGLPLLRSFDDGEEGELLDASFDIVGSSTDDATLPTNGTVEKNNSGGGFTR
jgi:hypothetical protein